MNNNNLQPFESGTKAVESGRKGGIKSGEEKRKKKLFKEVVKDILDQKPSKEEIEELKKKYSSIDIEEISIRTLLIDKQVQKAKKGDTKACEFILDLCGERPKENEDTEVKLPYFHIEVVDNSELQKEFERLEEECYRHEI